MRAVVQRVSRATVSVDRRVVGQIAAGLLVFVGIAADDGPADLEYIASKVRDLRIFPDDAGRMNRSLRESGGGLLVVSQFTLAGDARKGRRPSFDAAAAPEVARPIFERLLIRLRADGPVETGEFQAHMEVALVNDGPVTLLLDSKRVF
ncbi:MAG TPA: D-aminoacyl-tRNA deacylase [Vicinamibacterales bacterium]|nr:D-aminoacyl-tRNA deacylase [Vicinamibacterales bacterium]